MFAVHTNQVNVVCFKENNFFHFWEVLCTSTSLMDVRWEKDDRYS